jgi:hypothetical protein
MRESDEEGVGRSIPTPLTGEILPRGATEPAAPAETKPETYGNRFGCLLLGLGVVGFVISGCAVGYMYSGWHNSAYWGPGYSAVIGAVTLTAFGGLLFARARERAGRLRRLAIGVPAALIVAGSVALFLAALLGQGVRWLDAADYHGRYGTRVTVQLPEKCTYDETRYASGIKGIDPDIACDKARWQVGGRPVTGTAVIGGEDVTTAQGFGVPKQVEAFAMGDRAYSVRRVGQVESVAAYGALPPWLVLVAAILALLGLVGLGRARWFAITA